MSAIYPSVTSHATDAQPLAANITTANITTAGILSTNDNVLQLNCYYYVFYALCLLVYKSTWFSMIIR